MEIPEQNSHSAGGFVLNALGEVLMIYEGGWYLPKGRLEKGETNFEAAKREIREETGVTQLNYVKDLGEYQRYAILEDGTENHSELKIIHMFLFTSSQDELAPEDTKVKEARWVSKSEVCNLLSNNTDKEFAKEVLSKLD